LVSLLEVNIKGRIFPNHVRNFKKFDFDSRFIFVFGEAQTGFFCCFNTWSHLAEARSRCSHIVLSEVKAIWLEGLFFLSCWTKKRVSEQTEVALRIRSWRSQVGQSPLGDSE
jgi:hypothetical protein